MSKSALLFIFVLVALLGVALNFRTDLQRERARADALAERVAVFEPVERGNSEPANAASVSAQNAPPVSAELSVEASNTPSTLNDEPSQTPVATKKVRGSLHARQQVERLQAALQGATPLQDYQTQALVDAIDRLRLEQNSQKDNSSNEVPTNAGALDGASRGRLAQAAADILFESQYEKFMEVLDLDDPPQ